MAKKREPKMQFCCYCGAELGVYVGWASQHDTCGSDECLREERDSARCQQEEAQFSAEQDGWALYGGLG